MEIYLKITSLIGISFGATHFYGTLICKTPWKRVDLKHELTAKEARELTKRHGGGYVYKKGFLTASFDSEDDVRKYAIETYKTHFPNATCLLEGNPVYIDYDFVLLDGKE